MQKESKIILGIDPGTIVMGFAVIKINGQALQLLELNVLKLSSGNSPYEKLEKIYSCIQQLIKDFKPDQFAIEAPFFGKNVQSMLKLGRAQGVAIAAAIEAGLSVHEYSPKKIKQSITGNGNADKEQVSKMLQQLLQFKQGDILMDASDALAVAVCHHFQQNGSLPEKTGKSGENNWKNFIVKNPSRIK